MDCLKYRAETGRFVAAVEGDVGRDLGWYRYMLRGTI